MSIPYWRNKAYTDDGCSIFQCLHCYHSWEGRTDPIDWNFCPYCSIEWIGQLKSRMSYRPKWLWDKYEFPYELNSDQDNYQKFSDAEDLYRKSFTNGEDTRTCWLIQYHKGDESWVTEDAYMRGDKEGPKHPIILERLRELRKEHADQRNERISFYEDSDAQTKSIIDDMYPDHIYRVVIKPYREAKKLRSYIKRI